MSKTDDIRRHLAATAVMMDNLDKWRPQIEEAMRRGMPTHSFEDIVDLVISRKLTARFFDECFVLVSINEYPQAKHFHIFMAGGKLEALMAAQDELVDSARRAGCTRMTLNGRPGWKRALQSAGAREAYTMMAMEV